MTKRAARRKAIRWAYKMTAYIRRNNEVRRYEEGTGLTLRAALHKIYSAKISSYLLNSPEMNAAIKAAQQ